MSYIARQPVGRLRGIVDRFWHVEEAGTSSAPEVICPDGRTELVLHLADPMLERVGSSARMQPKHLLVGQMDRPIAVIATGRVAMVGARLAPGALYRLIQTPQDGFSGRILDLQSVWHRWTRTTADRIGAVDDPGTRLTIFEHALEALVPDSHDERSRGLDRAIARLDASGGNTSIGRLAQDCGLSRRQFERLFRDRVGLTPRLFGRIVKFQRAFQSLGTDSGAAIAARCGYADQAHLVHEMRRFAGQTPTMLADARGLTAFFRD
jgi:AraC-like DNA-binding protein